MFRTSFSYLPLILLFLLTGCQSTDEPAEESNSLNSIQAALEQEPSLDDAHAPLQALPPEVAAALRPQSRPSTDTLFGATKYDISADSVDAATFFKGLVKDTPFSVVIHPDVNGQISIELKQVELARVFELVSDIYGFDIQYQNNIYQIYPAGMRTETFSVNYLLMQRAGITQTSIQTGGVTEENNSNSSNNNNNSVSNFTGNSTTSNNFNNSNGTAISTVTDTNFWTDLENTLKTLIGANDGQTVVTTPQAGLVTVKAWPDEIREIKQFLRESEQNVQRQVILEARIVEVSLSDGYQQGINWTEVLANSGSTDFQFSTTAGNIGDGITATLGNVTNLAFVNQDFSGLISLLSTQGTVQVLSSPRVTAMNNQKAVIKVGDDEYFVTDVSTDSTTTSTTTTVTPSIELTPFFSGISLDVTPQIDDEGSVLLHVHPSVIETDEQEKTLTINNEEFILPLAQSNIRESDTVIRANSGEIVVIGGLMQSVITENESKTPLLGSIPLLGELFTSKEESEIKRELVILLKPTVIGAGTWNKELEKSQKRLAEWFYVD